jgi:putative ABC transport system permease protein
VSRTVFITGTVVEDQNRMREWNEYEFSMPTRRLSLTGTAPDTAVIGTGVARVLHLCAPLKVPNCAAELAKEEPKGDSLPDDIAALASAGARPSTGVPAAEKHPRIEILAANARGAPNVAAVTVLSAEDQGIKELDDVHVGLHLSQAQKLIYGSAPPQATAIALQLRHTAEMDMARQRLDALLASTLKAEPLGVLDFQVLNPFYGQARSMFAAIFGFIAVLIGAIVLFTVTNTMSMAVVERTSEIGTLRAIGVRRSNIRAMFVTEGLVLGCIGAVLGVLIAVMLAWVINRAGLTWLPPGRIEPTSLEVRVAGEYPMLILSSAVLVVVAAVSAIVPAARAARMDIVEALRHV